ncbi:MAG: RNA methyltransferase [Steroidobacteraceae bacterium]
MDAVPIRIVLVETSHPGNIGAAARAMKNMDLDELVLVRPKQFPHPEATARASGADDVLAQARCVQSVAEAVAGCGLVLATTARERDQYYRVLDVRAAARRAVEAATAAPVAILFGAERTGLTNEELASAHALLRIPTSSVYASLNLGMAVQLVAYEILRERVRPADDVTVRAVPLAPPAEMERLYEHLQRVLDVVEFRDKTQSGTHLIGRFRRFLQRAELDVNEVQILRGMLKAMEQSVQRAAAAPVDEAGR